MTGKSDLVCSVDISVGDALEKASRLVKSVNDMNEVGDLANDFLETGEDEIVYQAVGILRRRIQNVSGLKNEYHSCSEMDLSHQMKFVDPLLYKAIGWLTDKQLFDSAGDLNNEPARLPCLAIASDIIYVSRSMITPKHLGLANFVHHAYGSRKLIEVLHSHGYSISYDEYRRFQTSAALYNLSLQPNQDDPAKPYIPPEIQQNGNLIICAADNWDHNERTVGGTGTTHATTSIIVQRQDVGQQPSLRIPKAQPRALPPEIGDDLTNVIVYRKPASRPEPKFDPMPSTEELFQLYASENVQKAKKTEIVYNIVRCGAFESENSNSVATNKIPPWAPYQAAIRESEGTSLVSKVAFCPILKANPTDLSSIFTTMLRLKKSVNLLGQHHVPIVFDMGLLAKAMEITWAKPDVMAGVIPCDGGMHFLMCFMSAVGFLYADAGLKALLADSGVFAIGSASLIMNGKDYDRGIYALGLVEEVLSTRFYVNFVRWCKKQEVNIPSELTELIEQVSQAFLAKDLSSVPILSDQIMTVYEESLQHLIEQFRQEGRATSPTFQLWDQLLTDVLGPFKVLQSATKSSNWEVHLAAKAALLPLLFATNRTNYSRYMPAILLSMVRLPQHVINAFADGGFTAKLKNGQFNDVCIDYTLETTENKTLKGSGGVIGLTLRGQALSRWFLARPTTALYSMKYKDEVCHYSTQQDNVQRASVHRRWNADVVRMSDLFNGTFIDPFNIDSPPQQLVNIATGAVAQEDVEQSMLNSLQKGKEMAQNFIEERLLVSEDRTKKKSFYAPLRRSNIKTMSVMKKRIIVHDKEVPLDGEQMYMRLLAVNSRKKVALQRVMSFENAPVPLSMFNEDGTFVMTEKSNFLHKLESLSPGLTELSAGDCDAVVFDGNAAIHALPLESEKCTFKTMAMNFLQYIEKKTQKVAGRVKQVHIVFDRYMQGSIKMMTRERRGSQSAQRTHHVRPEAAVPTNWRTFLRSEENKNDLIALYTNVIAEDAGNHLGEGQQLFMSGGQDDVALVCRSVPHQAEPVPTLRSNQEEADTRIILHCVHASQGGIQSIIVCSPDTDVLVLLLHHRENIHSREIYFLTGSPGKHSDHTRFIPVHRIYEQLTNQQLNILLPVYCVTGCDTVSSFRGHGKITAFRFVMEKSQKYQSLSSLGDHPKPSDREKTAATRFVGELYGHSSCLSLDKLRCDKVKTKSMSNRKLPPTDDSFQQHLLRVVLQLMIWKQAVVGVQELPSVSECGYEMVNGKVSPVMMTKPVAAPELMNELACECSLDMCNTEQCCCFMSEQPCTGACGCEASTDTLDEDGACGNPLTYVSVDPEEDDD